MWGGGVVSQHHLAFFLNKYVEGVGGVSQHVLAFSHNKYVEDRGVGVSQHVLAFFLNKSNTWRMGGGGGG